MFNYNDRMFYGDGCSHAGHFPPEKPRYTMTEEMEHTSELMKDTIARLLRFEENSTKQIDDMLRRVASDNSIFKTAMRETWVSFIEEVKNEINSFESNIDNSVSFFKKDIETNYASLGDEVRRKVADNEAAYAQLLSNFEAGYLQAFDAYKNTLQNTIDNYNRLLGEDFANHTQEIDSRVTTAVGEMSRIQNEAVAYMKDNLNNSVTALLRDMQNNGEITGIIDSSIISSVKHAGAAGDGTTDDTAVFKNVFATSNNILIDNGVYLISDTIPVRSNTVVTIRNATILSNSNVNKKYVFDINGVENVEIYGENGVIEMSKAATAQQACINIATAKDVLVDGLTLKKAGGDGLQIGGTKDQATENVIISRCTIDNNRRNGISLIGGVDGVKIVDCTISNTSGTSPQIGIDVETWQAEMYNRNVEVTGCKFVNNEGGAFTVFEYTNGLKFHNNVVDGRVSVKVNNDYVNTPEAIPSNIDIANNTLKNTLYFYRISGGAFAVTGNVFDGATIMLDHSISLTAEDVKKAPAKLITGNVFINSKDAVYIGNNANITVSNNVVHDCNKFFTVFGLHNAVICNNIVTGYNAGGIDTLCMELFGKIKNVEVRDNTVQQSANGNPVTDLCYIKGGSVEGVKIHHNNFTNTDAARILHYDAQGNNMDYANSTPAQGNYCSNPPIASAANVGTIIVVDVGGTPTPKICVKDGNVYGWRNIQFTTM